MRTNSQRLDFTTECMNEFRLVGCERDSEFGASTHRFSEASVRAMSAVEDTSRRIEDLARRLGCLGHFDQTDGPRAA